MNPGMGQGRTWLLAISVTAAVWLVVQWALYSMDSRCRPFAASPGVRSAKNRGECERRRG